MIGISFSPFLGLCLQWFRSCNLQLQPDHAAGYVRIMVLFVSVHVDEWLAHARALYAPVGLSDDIYKSGNLFY